MTMDAFILLAMPGAQPGGQPTNPAALFGTIGPMLIIFGIMYFMLIRPQQRKEKKRRQMVENVKSGDRILFSGGIIGTVTNVKEGTLAVRLADNVKIEIARGAVNRVIEKSEKLGSDAE